MKEERKLIPKHYNRIVAGDFEIETTEGSLKETTNVMKCLIKEHTDFAIKRAEVNSKRSMGVIGIG